MLATLVIAMSLYQATAVPNQNAEVEFHHSEKVQGQMHDVRNTIIRTGATGAGQPTSVTLGTQYPERVFFINPPPPTGTVRTVKLGDIDVDNVTARDQHTADYVSDTLSFGTNALVYAPHYDQYGNAPETVYENTIVYNHADTGNATLTDQQLVRGKSITLVTLDGAVSQSRSGTMSIDPHAVSPSTTEIRTIPVRSNEGGNLTIRVSTGLSEEKWKELLEDQKYVESVGMPTDGILMVELQAKENDELVTYNLRLAKVEVGSGASSVEPHYVTEVSGNGTSVAEGGRQKLDVEVRDEYNNPVSGATVNFTLVDGDQGSLDNGTTTGKKVRVTTGADGRASVTYSPETPPANGGEAEVQVSIDDVPPGGATFDADRKETLAFFLNLVGQNGGNGGGDGGGDGGDGGNGSAANVEYVTGSGLAKANGSETTGVQFSLNNTGTENVTMTDITVNVEKDNSAKYVNETNGGKGADGQHEVFVDATEDGWLEMGDDTESQYVMDTTESPTDNATIAGGSETTVYIYEFKKKKKVVEMSEKTILVTIHFADGSSKTFEFVAETPNN
ncbi:hypothetical protein [Haladaptatus sp. NG-SE-30]